MSQPESHPIRNGVIGTVVGGLILAALSYIWAPLRSLFLFLWSAALAGWHVLVSTHPVPGWLFLLMVCGTLAFVVSRGLAAARNASDATPQVSEASDTMFGAIWHWSWAGGQIHNLWSSCPVCQAELVRLNERDSYLMSEQHAKFFCEHCREVRVDIPGGGHQYALSAVEREIRRRLRVSRESASAATS
jgi:hypothetical protein